MSAEKNKAITCRFVDEVLNQGNFAVADELLAPNLIFHFPGSLRAGTRESCKLLITMFREAFPDLHTTIEEQVIEGNTVITCLTFQGTHEEDFQGIPPTREQATFSGIMTLSFIDGKIEENWMHMDMPGLLQQLGMIQTSS